MEIKEELFRPILITKGRKTGREHRAYAAHKHFDYRGTFWNEGKREIMVRYFMLALIGIAQGSVAYFTNFLSHLFIEVSFHRLAGLLYFRDHSFITLHDCISQHNTYLLTEKI